MFASLLISFVNPRGESVTVSNDDVEQSFATWRRFFARVVAPVVFATTMLTLHFSSTVPTLLRLFQRKANPIADLVNHDLLLHFFVLDAFFFFLFSFKSKSQWPVVMLLLHTKETVVAAAALLLSGWLCGVITGAPTPRCFLYSIFPYVGTPGGETRPHPCRLSLLWGEKKGSWEKGWTWTREEAHHDGTLWGIFSYLHSDILTQQHWQFQKSLSSYCDDVSTESCFVKIKLYFVFFFGFFFTGRSLVLCFLPSSLLGKRHESR